MRGRLLVVAGVLAVAGPLTHVGAAAGPYRFLHDIHVGGEGGWAGVENRTSATGDAGLVVRGGCQDLER